MTRHPVQLFFGSGHPQRLGILEQSLLLLKRMFRSRLLLGILISGTFTTAWSHTSPCNEAFIKILYSDPDFVDRIREAFQRELQSHKEVLKQNLKDAAQEAQFKCNDTQCIEETLIRRSQIEEHVQKACPLNTNLNTKRNAGPIVQQIRNLAIGLSALGFAHTSNIKSALENNEAIPDFPFDITATVITLNLWRTWVMCKNEYNTPTEGLSWAKRSWKKFVAYQNVILFGNFIYIGFVMGEDWLRGEDVTSKEKLKAYGTEFVVSYVWDQAFAGLGVVAVDPILKRLPDLAPAISSRLSRALMSPGATAKLMSLNDKKFVFVRVGNPLDVFGTAIDYGFRWSYSATRSAAWMEVRKLLDSFSKSKQEEVPDFKE
jgi:hypothetical protein